MPPRKGQAKGGKGDAVEASYRGEDRGDRQRSGKGGKKGGGYSPSGGQQYYSYDDGEDDGERGRRRQGKGGKKGSKQDTSGEDWSYRGGGQPREDSGGGKRGGRGGGRGDGGNHRGDDRGREGDAAPWEGRSQLNSNAPDFHPSGFSYGGLYSPADMWGWHPQINPMPQMPPLWREYADESGTPYYYNSKTGLSQWERPPELDPPKPPPPPEGGGSADKGKDISGAGRRESGKGDAERDEPKRGGGAEGGGSGVVSGRSEGRERSDREGGGGGRGGAARGGRRRAGGNKSEMGASKLNQKESEFGPPGCNLFVFHLPDDWTDDDLHEYFAPHGNVVSAKVMKELGTGRSRGFGFVSYEDRVSAATAIKKMQGYKILGKRLKVEFKKGEQDGARTEADDRGGDRSEEDEGGSPKKGYPDDERLIGYLRAISAKNVVQSLKESESSRPPEDRPQEETPQDEGGEYDDD